MMKEFNLETKTREMLKEIDNTINTTFKASGVEVCDLIENMDETTGAALGGYMKMLKKAKGIASCQAEAMDFIVCQIQELRNEYKLIRAGLEMTHHEMRELKRKLEKIGVNEENAE